MRRALPATLTVALLAGCEQQEAVPLRRSVPVAALQLAVLLLVVGGGFVLLERAARRDPGRDGGERGPLAVLGTAVFAALGLAVTGIVALWITSLPGTYDQDTVSVLSWEGSVALVWILMVPALPLALLELRLAAACWARRRWAPWGAGIQVALLTAGVLGSVVASA